MALLTKRIPTIVGILVLVAGIVGGIMIVNNRRVTVNESAIEPKKVKITNVADNKFSVSWTTTTAVEGKVVYGKAGESLDKEVVDDRDTLSVEGGVYLTHHVTIKSLQPNTQYVFRVMSGSKGTLFDNNGSPYNITTGPLLTTTPPADTVYGEVEQPSTLPAEGAIVYLDIPGGVPLSTLVKSSGNWTIPLSTARTKNLSAYVDYDSKATLFQLAIEGGRQQASANLTTANSAPVPKITLGQTYDFRSSGGTDKGEEKVLVEKEATGSGTVSEGEGLLAEEPQTPGIFNVDPLGDVDAEAEVELLNPAEEGEVISSTLPEFRGTGEEDMVLTITVESLHTQTDTVSVETDGTWAWSPPADLEPGEHTITIAYLDTSGIERLLRRNFVVEASDGGGLPAFESTPSASLNPSPSSTASASPTPISSMPATTSGTPVSGIVGPTVLTAILGFVIMIAGALLMAL